MHQLTRNPIPSADRRYNSKNSIISIFKFKAKALTIYLVKCDYEISSLFNVDYYYLVDSGYACYRGFLPPYKRERYHLQAFRDGREPNSEQELFNYRHSSLRSIVERAFGVVKKRFAMLNEMPSYPVRLQRYYVIACMTIHNFIQKDRDEIDPLFKEATEKMYGEEWINISQRDSMPAASYVAPGERPDQSLESQDFMAKYRETMSKSMWDHANS
jgi:hypothetical protein